MAFYPDHLAILLFFFISTMILDKMFPMDAFSYEWIFRFCALAGVGMLIITQTADAATVVVVPLK